MLGLEWAFQVDMLVLLLVFAAGFHVYPLGFKHAGGLVYFNPPSSLTMKRFRSLSPCLRNGRLRRRQPPMEVVEVESEPRRRKRKSSCSTMPCS